MSQTSAMVSNIGAEFSTIKSLLNKEYQKLENLQHSIQKSSKEICAADLNQNPIEGIDVLQSINLKYHTIRRIKTVAQILLFLSASNSSVQIPHWKSTQKPGMIFWNIFNDMVAQKNSVNFFNSLFSVIIFIMFVFFSFSCFFFSKTHF